MTKSRKSETDIFSRRAVVELRARLNRLDIVSEAETAGRELFMEAAVAAAMIIAYADGNADPSERRRIIALFRAEPRLQGFSADDVAREIDAHDHAFALDHASAISHARARIVMSDMTNAQFRAVIELCVSVLEADGVRHPAEEEALAGISSMRPWGYR